MEHVAAIDGDRRVKPEDDLNPEDVPTLPKRTQHHSMVESISAINKLDEQKNAESQEPKNGPLVNYLQESPNRQNSARNTAFRIRTHHSQQKEQLSVRGSNSCKFFSYQIGLMNTESQSDSTTNLLAKKPGQLSTPHQNIRDITSQHRKVLKLSNGVVGEVGDFSAQSYDEKLSSNPMMAGKPLYRREIEKMPFKKATSPM